MLRRYGSGAAGFFPDGGCGLGWPGGKEALFWLGLREVERAAAGVVGLVVAVGAAPELGAGGVEVSVQKVRS